jgi:hypothetical protein
VNRDAFDRARGAFEEATKGMTDAQIERAVKRLVREIREEQADRAAMRHEMKKWTTTNSATSDATELDIFYSTLLSEGS